MGRIYSVTNETVTGVSVAAVQDIFSIIAASSNPLLIHAVILTQSSDVGDALEAFLEINLTVGHTTTGSGGTQPTANPLNIDDAAWSGTVTNLGANDTTGMTAGTAIIQWQEAFNIRTGMYYIPTPEMRIYVPVSLGFQVELMTTPTSPVDLMQTLIFEEL